MSRWAAWLSLSMVAVKRRMPSRAAVCAKRSASSEPRPLPWRASATTMAASAVSGSSVSRTHRAAAARLIVSHLGHEGGVVVAVHLGEVAQLGTGEVRLRGEEATADREVGQLGEARRELGLVTGLDGTDEHPMTVFE